MKYIHLKKLNLKYKKILVSLIGYSFKLFLLKNKVIANPKKAPIKKLINNK